MRDSQHCVDCGQPRKPLFLWVSDEVWRDLGYNPRDYACEFCMIDRLKSLSMAAFLVTEAGTHKCTPAAAIITMTQNRKDMVRAREKFYAT